MNRQLLVGMLLGTLFGVLISLGQPNQGMACIGFPGVLAAELSGYILFADLHPGWQIVTASVNGFFYALVGVAISWFVFVRRKSDKPRLPPIPECSICGFLWPRPDGPDCPQCEAKGAFRTWVGRCLPDYHCKCGYDLTGNESGVCSECGTAVKEGADRPK